MADTRAAARLTAAGAMTLPRAAYRAFDRSERHRLRGLAVVIAAFHLIGWGLVALYAPGHPVLGGLAILAYSFGLRHAFDADHISAIDNTTGKLLADGRGSVRPRIRHYD